MLESQRNHCMSCDQSISVVEVIGCGALDQEQLIPSLLQQPTLLTHSLTHSLTLFSKLLFFYP